MDMNEIAFKALVEWKYLFELHPPGEQTVFKGTIYLLMTGFFNIRLLKLHDAWHIIYLIIGTYQLVMCP